MVAEPKIENAFDYEFAMRFEGDIAEPHMIGNKMIFNVIDTKITGPGISGTGVPPAGDWITVRPDGTWNLDVRFSILLDDGEHALIQYNGIVKMTEEQLAKGQTEEGIDVDQVYFCSTPYFQTDSEKYSWLNDHVFIAKIVHFGGGKVIYDVYKIN